MGTPHDLMVNIIMMIFVNMCKAGLQTYNPCDRMLDVAPGILKMLIAERDCLQKCGR